MDYQISDTPCTQLSTNQFIYNMEQIKQQQILKDWIAEADAAIDMLSHKPISVYLEMFATDEPSLEHEAKNSAHYFSVRDCNTEDDPEFILRNLLKLSFETFRHTLTKKLEQS